MAVRLWLGSSFDKQFAAVSAGEVCIALGASILPDYPILTDRYFGGSTASE